jgi:hypothetical protein
MDGRENILGWDEEVNKAYGAGDDSAGEMPSEQFAWLDPPTVVERPRALQTVPPLP